MFQSTRPRGARPASRSTFAPSHVSFNPRARVGRDQSSGRCQQCWTMFQSTRPRGARPIQRSLSTVLDYVSIHAPAWGATKHRLGRLVWLWCFNPRARVGRDWQRRMTVHEMPSFNPRARVGRDRYKFLGQHTVGKFQSTRPRGARHGDIITASGWRLVSIHAPAWGATGKPLTRGEVGCCFNPRARVGRDHLMPCRRTIRQSFNPRARVGRDRYVFTTPDLLCSFNPRARVGRDHYPSALAWITRVSIHAPAWGATDFCHSSAALPAVSIHAPAWGATAHRISTPHAVQVFQSTRPRGARPAKTGSAYVPVSFQSTRPRGARPVLCVCLQAQESFQSTRPRGARLLVLDISQRVLRFNPRARVGRDILHNLLFSIHSLVSIHAPAWGATSPMQ